MKFRKFLFILFWLSIFGLTYFMLAPEPPYTAVKIKNIDKIEHFFAFLILTNLLLLSIKSNNPVLLVSVSSIFLCSYGFLIEQLQSLTGRNNDFKDFLFDVAGVAAGCIVSIIISSKLKKTQSK